ncbi:MAG: hypothetical protein HC897_00995 [Thermoanaerobaculia bacterium]|nr:hypothetical protein [Thermoanaerobaculia bacterium]
MALEEPDGEVLRQAIAAIAGLDETARAFALERLGRALSDPERRVVAHDVLVELRKRDVEIPKGGRSFWQSLRLAFEVRRAPRLLGQKTFESVSYGWCLFFAFVGALSTMFLIAVKTVSTPASLGVFASVLVTALVVAPWLARAVSVGGRAADRYLDWFPGWATEVMASGRDALLPFALLGAALLVVWPPFATDHWTFFCGIGLGILAFGFIFTAAIRLATLSCSALTESSTSRTLLGAGAGWGAGVAAATAMTLLAGGGISTGSESAVIGRWAAGFWFFALPVAAGVGAAFAGLERNAEVPKELSWRFVPWLLSLAFGLALLGCWTWFFWGTPKLEPLKVGPHATLSLEGSCHRLPIRREIEISGGSLVFGVIVDPTHRVRPRLWSPTDEVTELNEPGPVGAPRSLSLTPGKHVLEVVDADAVRDWERKRRDSYRFDPDFPTELFALAERLAPGEKPAAGSGSLCESAMAYPLGAQSLEKSLELRIVLEPSPTIAAAAEE